MDSRQRKPPRQMVPASVHRAGTWNRQVPRQDSPTRRNSTVVVPRGFRDTDAGAVPVRGLPSPDNGGSCRVRGSLVRMGREREPRRADVQPGAAHGLGPFPRNELRLSASREMGRERTGQVLVAEEGQVRAGG